MVEVPNILAIVLAVFLSPALPEGTIEIGKTPCEEAKAILQQHHLRLVDTEWLEGFNILEQAQITAPAQSLMAVHTLSFERTGTVFELGGLTQGSFFKKTSPPRAGLLLCGLFTEVDPKF